MNPTTPDDGAIGIAPAAPASTGVVETGSDTWIVGGIILMLFVAIVLAAAKRHR